MFWLNNDRDTKPPFTAFDNPGSDVYSPTSPDFASPIINSMRDLEDYARLWICGVPALTNGAYQVSLSWTNISAGSPAIKLFRAAETNSGGIGYLTDPSIALAQTAIYAIGTPFYQSIGTLCPGQPISFTPSSFTNGANKYLLFEGCTNGAGELVITITQNATNVMAQTSAWLDLRDITTLYEQAHIEGVETQFPDMRTSTNVSTFKSDYALGEPPGETKQLIVFVHGWNDPLWLCANYAQTTFKRLYWQGYQGRFAALHWPTLVGPTTYNRSEFIALHSAHGVAAYFDWLQSRFPDYSINVIGHSMGNVVMMETLRLHLATLTKVIDNYILTQAAEAAHCYDPSLPDYARFTDPSLAPTPDTYRGFPGAISNAVNGALINFFNTNDFALVRGSLPIIGEVSWEKNQVSFKPDTGFGYSYSTNFSAAYYNGVLVTDARELMPFVARPRSKAVGALDGVRGMIQGEVDLTGRFGFGRTMAEHSAQFNWTIQQVHGYYEQILTELFPRNP